MPVLRNAARHLRARASAARALAAQQRPRLRGVVFDMDGTLTVPNLNFKEMYARCGVGLEHDLLAEVMKMAPPQRAAAEAVIAEMEAESARTLALLPGVAEVMHYLRERRVPTALVTRNSNATLEIFHETLWHARGLPAFALAISRDGEWRAAGAPTGAPLLPSLPAKPDPASLRAIAARWGVALPSPEVLMVGDSPSNDVAFGKAGGAATALVDSGRRYLEKAAGKGVDGNAPDYVVESLAELPALLEVGYELV